MTKLTPDDLPKVEGTLKVDVSFKEDATKVAGLKDKTSISHGHPPVSNPLNTNLSRRKLMSTSAVVLTVTGLAISTPWQSPLLFAQTDVASTTSASNSAQAKFMALSQTLTGHDDLRQDLGDRLYTALKEKYKDLDEQVIHLQSRLSDTSQWTPEESQMATAILEGWFSGVVKGSHSGDGKLISYEGALMFGVANYQLIRTYCADQPGFWTTNPNKEIVNG